MKNDFIFSSHLTNYIDHQIFKNFDEIREKKNFIVPK